MAPLSRGESSPLNREDRREAPQAKRSSWRRSCIVAGALLLASAPRAASADLPGDRVEFGMYGRMGIAWGVTGPQMVQGQSMNLDLGSIGGRLEEGDYLEPTVKAHIIKPDQKEPDATAVDFVLTPALVSNGSFLGAFSNGFQTANILLFQAFIEARNVFTPGLSFWGGQRFYRGTDVHIADYFYFNPLNGQGGGARYKDLDVAIVMRSSLSGDRQYNFNVSRDPDVKKEITRQRTVLVGQYVYKFGERSSSVRGLAEFHILPPLREYREKPVLPGDYGYVFGAQLHLDLDRGNFNDFSVRYGTRIANGALFGSATYFSYGDPDPTTNTYDGALGLEVVDHFLFNINPLFTINGYGILHYGKGGAAQTPDAAGALQDNPNNKGVDFAIGARGFLYAHKNFHMIAEASFQGRKDGDKPMGTATKVSLMPTIVPSGETIAWARPHMRLIYTAGFYNQAAVDNTMSPYLRNISATKVAHYLGARTEWWF